MPDYGRYCPIALGTEVVADRWTPLILRELILGNTRFNEIARGMPGISRSLLTQRLRHLESRGVVELWPSPGGRGNEYHLTPAGKDLETVIMAIGRWAVEWLHDDVSVDDPDLVTLTWWMHRRIDQTKLPAGRVVVQFDHTAPEKKSIWMVFERREPSVCTQHPGFEPDVIVTTTTPALASVFAGTQSWSGAIASGAMKVAGVPAYTKAISRWFLWSPFAEQAKERSLRVAAV